LRHGHGLSIGGHLRSWHIACRSHADGDWCCCSLCCGLCNIRCGSKAVTDGCSGNHLWCSRSCIAHGWRHGIGGCWHHGCTEFCPGDDSIVVGINLIKHAWSCSCCRSVCLNGGHSRRSSHGRCIACDWGSISHGWSCSRASGKLSFSRHVAWCCVCHWCWCSHVSGRCVGGRLLSRLSICYRSSHDRLSWLRVSHRSSHHRLSCVGHLLWLCSNSWSRRVSHWLRSCIRYLLWLCSNSWGRRVSYWLRSCISNSWSR